MKIILVDGSPLGWSKATCNVVTKATNTINNIERIHDKRCTAEENKIGKSVNKCADVIVKIYSKNIE